MTVTGYLCDKILYINLSGEMDECSAQTARAKCDSLIEENASAQKIVINLSGVAFMDSTGMIGLPHARPLMVWFTTAWKIEADRSSFVAPSLMRG